MSEIRIYSKFGEKIAKPFEVNRVFPEDNSEEETIINSSSEDATNQDSKVAEDINADN